MAEMLGLIKCNIHSILPMIENTNTNKSLSIVFVLLNILLLLLVAWGLFKLQVIEQKLSELENNPPNQERFEQIVQLLEKQSAFSSAHDSFVRNNMILKKSDLVLQEEKILELNKNEPDICKHKAITNDIGSYSFPSDPQYGWFGEIFTAHDCGRDLNELFWVTDGMYTPGVDVTFEKVPSEDFRAVLEDIGFECRGNDLIACDEWVLEKPVPVQELLKLKPFTNVKIKLHDCIHCG